MKFNMVVKVLCWLVIMLAWTINEVDFQDKCKVSFTMLACMSLVNEVGK
jgi:hypothetical protein